MNTFAWVVCGIVCAAIALWLLLPRIADGVKRMFRS
jgi:hypothetical protein